LQASTSVALIGRDASLMSISARQADMTKS